LDGAVTFLWTRIHKMAENIKTRREGAFVILADSTNLSSASRNGRILKYEQTVISALIPGIRYETEWFKSL